MEPVQNTEELFGQTQQYVRSTATLYKLKAISRSADVLSGLAIRISLAVLAGLFFLTVNVGIALWLGDILGKNYYGFFVVAGFYVIAATGLYCFRNSWIRIPVRNFIAGLSHNSQQHGEQ